MHYLRRLPARAGETSRIIRSLIATAALCVVMLGVAPLAMAQTPIDPPTPSELEEFRLDLTQALQEMEKHRAMLRQNKTVRDALAKSKFASAPPLAKIEQQLQQMTYEELSQVYRGFAIAFPNWREAPQSLGRMADKIGGKRLEGREEKTLVLNAITPDNCQDAFNAAPSWTDWGVTKAFAIAAQGAYEIIPPPINAVAMALWIPLEEGANAAEILNLIFERCSGDNDSQAIQTAISTVQTSIINNDNSNVTTILNSLTTAKNEIVNNDNDNRTTIVNNDNSNRAALTTTITSAQTSINNNVNANSAAITAAISNAQTSIINNDNSNTAAINAAINDAKTTIINNDNANKNELRDLLLRTQIEADLAEADNATPVAWYLTPTANGGHLNLVQSIVTQTLANIQAAGGGIGDAQSFLNQANADKAAGRFKDAYKNYRKAYKAAAN